MAVTASLVAGLKRFPIAPSHKLGALVDYAPLPVTGRYHRALADAEMAARLLLRLNEELRLRHRVPQLSVDLLRRIQRAPKAQLRCERLPKVVVTKISDSVAIIHFSYHRSQLIRPCTAEGAS